MIKDFFIAIYHIILYLKKFLVHIYKTIHPAHWGLILFFSIGMSYLSLPILFNKFNIEFHSYKNINVTVQDYVMNGMLNNYTTIRKLSNKCYHKYCGLSGNGEYKLSEIKFISIHGRKEIFSFCIDEKCFSNIDNSLIEEEKKELTYKATVAMWSVLFLIIVVYVQSACFEYLVTKKHKKTIYDIDG
ncbi:hypothetical protein L4F92_05885 [Avibacterium sp. 21-595]|uniref:hypothetical protein n=1 Tax=Avibacterium sp. 21-595 TaxID=2911527 RepID=UPI0020265E1E|nr:hypothetical protein [Avibacterium sp. 21-595]URL05621.1 hypothetical protein L4F92_05885 [Avibacterium sp. 21-595]